VPPGGNKATLTLASGARITLDSAHSGELTRQGNMRVIQLDSGRLAYETATSGKRQATSPGTYNTITTPRGGQYRVVLADGTRVWLNAASSLQYPTAFTGKTREVILQGEAYFEVAARADQPFIVQTGKDSRIEVLGTFFNITNYPDEKNILTTLIKGAVRVDVGKESHLLSPGQQARATALPEGGTRLTITSDINPEQVMAWKDGLFDFQDMPFDRVMRQLSRWYDIDVVYEDGVPDIKFEGQLGRDVNLSRILFFFQKVGVHYHMEGTRKLVISK
jgi:transmembrane sensor